MLPDPFDHPDAIDHTGVAQLRAARDLLDAGDAPRAAEAAASARRGPLPAEIVPHASMLHAAALTSLGELDAARAILEDTWATHPDVAALPALLSAVLAADGQHAVAARTAYAALINEDPDASLAIYRPLLTRHLGLVSRNDM
jgi:hypothetical protein